MVASIMGMNLETPIFHAESWVFDVTVSGIVLAVTFGLLGMICCVYGRHHTWRRMSCSFWSCCGGGCVGCEVRKQDDLPGWQQKLPGPHRHASGNRR